MIRELIRFARVTLAKKDTTQFPVQQVAFMENAADAFMIFPYGMHANAAVDALAVLFSVNGDEQSLAAIATAAKDRIKNLEPGEVIFFHPKTKSFTHYKNSGDVDISVNGSQSVTIKQNWNITVDGNVNLTAAAVNVTTPNAVFSGAVQCVSLTVSGGASMASATIGGKDFGTHKHAPGTYQAGGDNVTGNSGNPA